MNYLRLNKCVDYGYVERVNNNSVILNLGYGQVNVIDDFGGKPKLVDSSKFFRNMADRVRNGI
jgi:uncharacterized protein YkvS